MEIRVKLKDGKILRSFMYRIRSDCIELIDPYIYSYEKFAFIPFDQDFVLIPFSNIRMVKGNIKSRAWKEIW